MKNQKILKSHGMKIKAAYISQKRKRTNKTGEGLNIKVNPEKCALTRKGSMRMYEKLHREKTE